VKKDRQKGPHRPGGSWGTPLKKSERQKKRVNPTIHDRKCSSAEPKEGGGQNRARRDKGGGGGGGGGWGGGGFTSQAPPPLGSPRRANRGYELNSKYLSPKKTTLSTEPIRKGGE